MSEQNIILVNTNIHTIIIFVRKENSILSVTGAWIQILKLIWVLVVAGKKISQVQKKTVWTTRKYWVQWDFLALREHGKKKNTWQRLFNNKKVVEFMFHVQAFAEKWGHCSKCNHSVRFYFYFNFSSKLLELPYFPTTVSVNLFFFSWEKPF